MYILTFNIALLHVGGREPVRNQIDNSVVEKQNGA